MKRGDLVFEFCYPPNIFPSVRSIEPAEDKGMKPKDWNSLFELLLLQEVFFWIRLVRPKMGWNSKLYVLAWNDEAHFWLNGYVNKQNCRIWSEANPQVYVETPLHPEKLTVWCALWAGGILLQKRWRPQRYSQW
ncbi:hypothetical protein TNCV_185681 [Trichonephila clavipes]|nr:hypothetical protein TNCV_185681 [Trichonephila clavipes]